MRLRKQILCVVLLSLLGLTGRGTAQVDDAPSLAGVIDIHAHTAPETSMMSVSPSYLPTEVPIHFGSSSFGI